MMHSKNVIKFARTILVDHMFGGAYGPNDSVIDRLRGCIPAVGDTMNSRSRSPHLQGYSFYSSNASPPKYPNGYWAPTEELPPGVQVDNEKVIASICKVAGTDWLTSAGKQSNCTQDVVFLRDVVTNLPALHAWCHTVLSDVSKPWPLTRFTKMPDVMMLKGLKYEPGRAYPLKYLDNISDGTLLWLWENFKATGGLPFVIEDSSGGYRVNTMMVLKGELAAAPVINRKVSSKEVLEYVSTLADFLRAQPVVAGLLVAGHATDDEYVQWFLMPHQSFGEAVHQFSSSRYASTWQNAMANELARGYLLNRATKGSSDVPLLVRIRAATLSTEYVMDKLLSAGIPLEPTKELIVALHHKLMDVDNGVAAELSLGNKDWLSTRVGLRAMAVTGFADKGSLVKMIASRIKQTSADYFGALPTGTIKEVT